MHFFLLVQSEYGGTPWGGCDGELSININIFSDRPPVQSMRIKKDDGGQQKGRL